MEVILIFAVLAFIAPFLFKVAANKARITDAEFGSALGYCQKKLFLPQQSGRFSVSLTNVSTLRNTAYSARCASPT